jgi:hypothetical protein
MTSTFPAGSETVFTYGAPLLKFGTGTAARPVTAAAAAGILTRSLANW